MSYQIQLIYQNNVRITDNQPRPGINNFLKLSTHWYIIHSIMMGDKQVESTTSWSLCDDKPVIVLVLMLMLVLVLVLVLVLMLKHTAHTAVI